MAASNKMRARKHRAKQGGSVESDLRDCVYKISGRPVYLHSKEQTYKVGMKVASQKLETILTKAMDGAKAEIKRACLVIEKKWIEVYKACGFQKITKEVRDNFPQWWKTNVEDYGLNSSSQFKLLAMLQRIKELETIEKKYTEARKRAVNKSDESILIKEGFFNPITGEDHAQEIGVRQADSKDPITEKRKELKDLRAAFVKTALKYFYKELPESKMTKSGRLQYALASFWQKLRESDKTPLLDIFYELPVELKQRITGKQATEDIQQTVNETIDKITTDGTVQQHIKKVGYTTGIGVLYEALSHGFQNNNNITITNISELSDPGVDNKTIKADTKITIGNVEFFTNDKTTIVPKFGWQPDNPETALTELGHFGTHGFSASLSTSLETVTADLGPSAKHLKQLQDYVLANSSFSNRMAEEQKRIILSIYAWLKIVLEIIGKESNFQHVPIAIRVFGHLYRTDDVLKEIEKLQGTQILQIVKGVTTSKFFQAKSSVTEKDKTQISKRKSAIIQDLRKNKKPIRYETLYADPELQTLFRQAITNEVLKMPTSLYFLIKLQNDTIRIGE